MMINLKSLGLATAALITAGMFNPAWGISVTKTLQDLINLGPTGETVGNFTFSDFNAGIVDTGDETTWLGFSATLSDGGGSAPSLSLSGNLTITGTYTLTYLLTASGSSNLAFDSIDQTVPCLSNNPACLGNLNDGITTSTIVKRTDMTGDDIGGADDSASNVFDKGAINNPIYVDTLIGYSGGGSYTGLTQTYQAQAVPFESDVLPLVGATLLFGGGMWWKRRRAAASQLDLTQPGPEQEHESNI